MTRINWTLSMIQKLCVCLGIVLCILCVSDGRVKLSAKQTPTKSVEVTANMFDYGAVCIRAVRLSNKKGTGTILDVEAAITI